MQFSEQEKQTLLACINIAIKNAPNAIQAAADLIPLAQKVASIPTEPAHPQESQQ